MVAEPFGSCALWWWESWELWIDLDLTLCHYDKDYAANGIWKLVTSGIVNTAWVLLSRSMAEFENVECENVEAIKLGVQYLMVRQLPSSD